MFIVDNVDHRRTGPVSVGGGGAEVYCLND